jgi:hypothetical protein
MSLSYALYHAVGAIEDDQGPDDYTSFALPLRRLKVDMLVMADSLETVEYSERVPLGFEEWLRRETLKMAERYAANEVWRAFCEVGRLYCEIRRVFHGTLGLSPTNTSETPESTPAANNGHKPARKRPHLIADRCA